MGTGLRRSSERCNDGPGVAILFIGNFLFSFYKARVGANSPRRWDERRREGACVLFFLGGGSTLCQVIITGVQCLSFIICNDPACLSPFPLNPHWAVREGSSSPTQPSCSRCRQAGRQAAGRQAARQPGSLTRRPTGPEGDKQRRTETDRHR